MTQLGKNVLVVVKKEGSINVAPGTGSATTLRANASPGMDVKKASIKSNEFRKDGQTAMARQGTVSAPGSYEFDLVVGALDTLIDGLMRAAVSALMTANSGDFTTVAITLQNTITWASGNPITKGFKVGDVFRFTASANAANNNIWLRIVSLTATTIVVAGTPLTNQGADGTAVLSRPKKWINGATPTRASYWIEQYFQDLTKGDQFGGARVIGGKVSVSADGMIKVTLTLLGLSGLTNQVAYFVAPTLPAGTALASIDALVRLNGVDYADITSFEINFGIGGSVPGMVGTNTAPDVAEGNLEITGSITFLMSDTVRQALWVGNADAEWELMILAQTPTGTPKDFVSFFLPRCKFMDMSDPIGSDGNLQITAPFTCGIKDVTSGYDSTTILIGTSAP